MSTPSPQLKDLYRRIIKRIHPDYAISEQDRARCERLMKVANDAYEAGDEVALRAVLDPEGPHAQPETAPPAKPSPPTGQHPMHQASRADLGK